MGTGMDTMWRLASTIHCPKKFFTLGHGTPQVGFLQGKSFRQACAIIDENLLCPGLHVD